MRLCSVILRQIVLKRCDLVLFAFFVRAFRLHAGGLVQAKAHITTDTNTLPQKVPVHPALTPTTLPTVRASSSSCGFPEAVVSSDFDGPVSLRLNTSTQSYEVYVTKMYMCEFTEVRIKPLNGLELHRIDLESPPVQASLALFGEARVSGAPCDSKTVSMPDCDLLIRRLPLTLSEDRASLIGKVFPDPSFRRYAIRVQVKDPISVVAVYD
jgi:hypothetical protein